MKPNFKLLLLCFFTSLLLCFSASAQQEEYSCENLSTKEISYTQFLDLLINKINLERSFKGLIPLEADPIAVQVAGEQANDLVLSGYLSYFNSKKQCPDERYTLAGGTGVTTEVVKAFEAEQKNQKKIKLTELLACQLVQAILLSSDDAQILFNPQLSHVGCGIALSEDKKRFASVIEFVTKGGESKPLKPFLALGEKINVTGKINPPYRFKAVSISYFDEQKLSELQEQGDIGFNNENLVPYFPPQDYIAYGDTKKTNILKVLKGLGAIGAIGGAPFTGGATAVLAPMFISSIQCGQPKEVPLKGGIKANSKGEFSGQIDLNYQGMSGLYFISILAELPSINYPIVVSRRTVRVTSPLQGVKS